MSGVAGGNGSNLTVNISNSSLRVLTLTFFSNRAGAITVRILVVIISAENRSKDDKMASNAAVWFSSFPESLNDFVKAIARTLALVDWSKDSAIEAKVIVVKVLISFESSVCNLAKVLNTSLFN
ncbi:hypothetical protein WICPIJ_002942 [Wickerhamomyces pijperi]|uniref:Uncharacterized protein n=1 Tax=Wickerhamomyces pijperi TaxID=599730 RepID=A0A9P8Q8M6_WICPI|nr:hypothetical protein WICPIJ_002942 [Wickerhamomyces pijperi]